MAAPLAGAVVHVRPGASDGEVVSETFVGRYHLPPERRAVGGPLLRRQAAAWTRDRLVAFRRKAGNEYVEACTADLQAFGFETSVDERHRRPRSQASGGS